MGSSVKLLLAFVRIPCGRFPRFLKLGTSLDIWLSYGASSRDI